MLLNTISNYKKERRDTMKIVEVRVVRANRSVFAKITTDNGYHGIGESGAWGALEASAAAIQMFGDYLVGKNPLMIHHHWQYMQRSSHFKGAALMGAISAIDVALYDIAGKYFNVPIYQLLGGKTRDKVRVYYQTKGQTEEELYKSAKAGVEQGFNALGHLNLFLDEPRDKPFEVNYSRMLTDAERRIKNIREIVGNEVDLCLEMHRRFEPGFAVQLSKVLEKYNPMFIEDPIRPNNINEMGKLASKINIPIATGERFNSLYEFSMLLEQGPVQYLRVSLAVCGGFTGAKKIAALAEAHHCSIVPHNPLSPITGNAVLQLCASIDNVAIAEYPNPESASTADNLLNLNKSVKQKDMVTNMAEFDNGYVIIPHLPGLGTDLVEDVEEKFPYKPHPVSTRLNVDGSICDQ